VFFRRERGAEGFLDAWDAALRRNASASEGDAFNLVARAQPLKPLKARRSSPQPCGARIWLAVPDVMPACMQESLLPRT
jgi:hypothetical protein